MTGSISWSDEQVGSRSQEGQASGARLEML